MWAQTKLLWTNRMRPHVSPKSKPTPPTTPRQLPAASPSGRGASSAAAPGRRNEASHGALAQLDANDSQQQPVI